MPITPPPLTNSVHLLVSSLPRFGDDFATGDLPKNGVYLFLEEGETATVAGQIVDRIVRVGTHRGADRLPRRLQNHFAGRRRFSVFRRHLGAALLHRDDPNDPVVAAWVDRRGEPLPEIEARIDALLRGRFTFCCIRVEAMADRLALERGLIALLAQRPSAPPSPDWLGRHALHPTVRETGLWNTRETDAAPLTEAQLGRLIAAAG